MVDLQGIHWEYCGQLRSVASSLQSAIPAHSEAHICSNSNVIYFSGISLHLDLCLLASHTCKHRAKSGGADVPHQTE